MAIVTTDDKHYKGIANAIRAKVGTTYGYTPSEMAMLGIDEVYESGFKEGEEGGYKSGKTEGIEEGKQAQYDLFWNTFQRWNAATQTTKRTDYRYAFAYWYLADAIFKPKYDIVPEGDASYMFWNFRTQADLTNITNMDGKKIDFDFSKVTKFENMFYHSLVQKLGTVDCSSATSLSLAFNNDSNSITEIEKLIVHEGITTYSNAFANSSKINKLIIEGTIAGTGFHVSAHTGLSYESLMSIVDALKDYSGTTTTKSITLGATNLAKLTDAEKAIATDKGWTLT